MGIINNEDGTNNVCILKDVGLTDTLDKSNITKGYKPCKSVTYKDEVI